MYENTPDDDAVLAQFNRLMQDVIRGSIRRNTFRPWEIELLLDIQDCPLRDGALRQTLQRYQKAVQRQMEKGAHRPAKLSEYLYTRVHARRQEPNSELRTA